MDLHHFIRLNESRRELEDVRRRVERGPEAEVAEALGHPLQQALIVLRQLHLDDAIWRDAQQAVGALPPGSLADVARNYSESLPRLLDLFGYEVPPPPSAEELVRETVNLVDVVRAGGAAVEEVVAARQSLGELLSRADDLPQDPPWKLAQNATEVNGYLELGIQVGVGALAGGVAAAFASVLAGAVTGGVAPVAGFVVLGGVRRFQRVNAIQREVQRLATEGAILTERVFSTAGAVVSQYLDSVEVLSVEAEAAADPNASMDLRLNLEAVLDITRRFVIGESRLGTVVNQASLRDKLAPAKLLLLFRKVYVAADQARTQLSLNGDIEKDTLAELELLSREIINAVE